MDVANIYNFMPGLTAAVSWAGFFGFLGLVLRLWLTQRPAMRKLKQDGETALRDDLVEQIKGLRDERAADRTEIKTLSGRLTVVEAESRRRGDRISNLTFIVQLVMNELQRIDPKSVILNQAARLMIQLSQPLDANPADTLRDLARIDDAIAKQAGQSATLNAAEDTERAAEETCEAAADAVRQVKFDEEKGRQEGGQ